MKESFNSVFDEVYRSKVAEVKRIEEKNVRIKKILGDLGLDDVILEPVMDTDERPETLLDVKDSEVPFERFITKEEQAKIEEEKKKDEGTRYTFSPRTEIVNCMHNPRGSAEGCWCKLTLFISECKMHQIYDVDVTWKQPLVTGT